MAENTTDKEALKAQKEAEKAAEKAKKERIKASKPKKEGNVFSRAGKGIRKYWKDFTGTCKKIIWPTGKQVAKNSGVTIVTILIIGLIVFGFDIGLTKLFEAAENGASQLGEGMAVTQEAEETTAEGETADAGETEETTAEETEETETEDTETEETTAEETTVAE